MANMLGDGWPNSVMVGGLIGAAIGMVVHGVLMATRKTWVKAAQASGPMEFPGVPSQAVEKVPVATEVLVVLAGVLAWLNTILAGGVAVLVDSAFETVSLVMMALGGVGAIGCAVVLGLRFSRRIAVDGCPRCKTRYPYYRKDVGLALTCSRCNTRWQAGAFPVRR